MKKNWRLLIGCIAAGIIVLNLDLSTSKQEKKQLMLRNIEALAGNESGEDHFPCTVAGGFCYGNGIMYWGISLI